jgi:ATP-dependent Clp protease ATP-binding subunit ClpA
MSAPDAYLANFSDSGKRVLQGALDESCRRGQNYVSPAHILFALIEKETELFDSAVTNLSINSNSLRQAVENDLENSRRHSGRGFRISPETTKLFKVSMDKARSEKRRVIEASDILYVLITDKNSVLNNILRSGSEK